MSAEQSTTIPTSHKSPIHALCDAKDDRLLIGDDSGKITLVNTDTHETVKIWENKASVNKISMYEDFIVASDNSGKLNIWSIDSNEMNGKELRPNKSYPILDYNIVDSRVYFASRASSSPIFVYDLHTLSLETQSESTLTRIKSIAVVPSSTGNIVYACSADGLYCFDSSLSAEMVDTTIVKGKRVCKLFRKVWKNITVNIKVKKVVYDGKEIIAVIGYHKKTWYLLEYSTTDNSLLSSREIKRKCISKWKYGQLDCSLHEYDGYWIMTVPNGLFCFKQISNVKPSLLAIRTGKGSVKSCIVDDGIAYVALSDGTIEIINVDYWIKNDDKLKRVSQ